MAEPPILFLIEGSLQTSVFYQGIKANKDILSIILFQLYWNIL